MSVTSLNPIAPTLELDSFDFNQFAVLQVPDVEAYKGLWYWLFPTIVEIDLNTIRSIEAGKKNISTPTTIYDLSGRRVTEPVKGRIYIVDGKTVVW